MTQGTSEHTTLQDQLRELVCNRAERAVCCQKNFELTEGTAITDPRELPFMVYIHLKNGRGSVECGASIVASEFLITAKHCLSKFDDGCQEESQCTASFRDLDKSTYEEGEFDIPIFDVIEHPGKSDLALVQLIMPFESHPDYGKGVPLKPVKLASRPPRPQEKVQTAGWGRTGFKEPESDKLLALNLTVTRVTDTYIYTDVHNAAGKITDTCSGKFWLYFVN